MFYLFFFFDVTPTTEIYTLSLHDALPILTVERLLSVINHVRAGVGIAILPWGVLPPAPWTGFHAATLAEPTLSRSEEHTSELQSRLHLVCRLLLEKKKKKKKKTKHTTTNT